MHKAPELAWDMHVFYCLCSRRGERDEATGEHHNCLKMVDGGWSECATRKSRVGERVTELYVLSAGGQPAEKWRQWNQVELGFHKADTEYQLLWRAPFSNFSQVDFPVVPRGGRLWFYDGGETNNVLVRIKILGRSYWEFLKGDDCVQKWLEWILETC